MSAYDQMNTPYWNDLDDKGKMILMRQILMYYVSPLKLIRNVRLKTFRIRNMKCRTFEFTIDGEPFVFVPGNQHAILGWEKGNDDDAIWKMLTSTTFLDTLKDKDHPHIPSYDELTLHIRQHTSPLRECVISPMIVSKYAIPFLGQYIGFLNTVTGQFNGKHSDFETLKDSFYHLLYPKEKLDLKEALQYEFPYQLNEKTYFARQDIKKNGYFIYVKKAQTVEELYKRLHRYNYDLPLEEEYEYLTGGTFRKLFFYSDLSHYNQLFHREATNMFGIHFSTREAPYVLIQDETYYKGRSLDVFTDNFIYMTLPLSPSFRIKKENANTAIENVYYHKIIRIEP